MALTLRPATPGDAAAITDLVNAVDLIEIGRPETDLHTMEADLEHPETDLAKDSWLAYADGVLVGYGLVWGDSGAERIDMDHYVLPDRQDVAVRLLDLMEARTVERVRANGAARAVVHLHLNTEPTLDTALIEKRGWRPVRRYQVMVRDVSPRATPAPTPPSGVTLRDCTAEADHRRAHELCELTFAAHFDHRPRTYEQWSHDLDAGRLDWSLIRIASVEGLGDAGVMLGRDDREAMGWINNVGVVEEARGRGIGGFLLRDAFAAFAARGRESVGLGVDTANETGALRLYENNGMRTHFAVNTWEVVLPV
ncbi:GNAT family N-acetyltransferase [Streptomyces sp. NPDC087420]|uniref:GNAT family N-acetyltransferase n=1 Tax=Streptomyces sp. NPDC087420 TaxID=3365785 RepID=UPI0038346FA7